MNVFKNSDSSSDGNNFESGSFDESSEDSSNFEEGSS